MTLNDSRDFPTFPSDDVSGWEEKSLEDFQFTLHRMINYWWIVSSLDKSKAIIEFSTLVRHFETLKWIMIQQIEWLLKDYFDEKQWQYNEQQGKASLRRAFAEGFSHAAFIDVTQFVSLSFNCQLLVDPRPDFSWINIFMCADGTPQ